MIAPPIGLAGFARPAARTIRRVPLFTLVLPIHVGLAIALFLLVALIERVTIPWARSGGGRMK